MSNAIIEGDPFADLVAIERLLDNPSDTEASDYLGDAIERGTLYSVRNIALGLLTALSER